MTWCYRLSALAVAAALTGCGTSDASGTGGSSSGSGGEGASEGATVTFLDESPLAVAPGQEIRLSIHADPPAERDVSFLLLGDSLDASLDRSASRTDAAGNADLMLLAPSQAASFKVRATLGDLTAAAGQGTAELVIQVSELGVGSLRIVPDYQGNREIATWRASVVAQARCDDFMPPDDPEGADVVEAPPDEDLVVDDAIVGPSLAVLVRSERKVWGCAETALSHAGEMKEVVVPVLDRPLDLSTAALDLSLLLADPPPELEQLFTAADARLADAAFPEDEEAASVLLDAMVAPLPAEVRDLFDQARQASSLDDDVAADLAARAVDVRALVETMLAAGRPLGPTFLTGRLSSAEADASHALLHVETLAGVDGELAGVPSEHLLSFVANPGDTVVIGAESGILFFPTRLVGALAERAALADAPDGAAFSSTLADAVGCADVAYVVGPLGDCDVACVEAACRLGLEAIWEESLDASASDADIGVFSVVLSGQGVVDENAALVALDPAADNSWVGVLQGVERQASIGGTAIALEADDEAAGTTAGEGGSGGAGGAGEAPAPDGSSGAEGGAGGGDPG